MNTGITGSDRYLAFTNCGVINQAGQPEIVAENVVNRFLPKDASETPAYDLDGNLQSDGRWDYTWNALNRLTKIESKSTAPYASKHQILYTTVPVVEKEKVTGIVSSIAEKLKLVGVLEQTSSILGPIQTLLKIVGL